MPTQPMPDRNATAAGLQRAGRYERLARRYGGDRARALRIKKLLIYWRAQFDDARRARLFEDQILRVCELRDNADQARIAAPATGDYGSRSPEWILEDLASRAEADLRRLTVPGLLDASGADASGAALLAALGLGPQGSTESPTERGLSEPVSNTAPTQEHASDSLSRAGGARMNGAASETAHGSDHEAIAEPAESTSSVRSLPPSEWSPHGGGR